MPPSFTTVIDNFNRGNGAPGANWSGSPFGGGTSGMTISSNQLVGDIAQFTDHYWNASTFGPDMAVGCTVVVVPSGGSASLRLLLGLVGGVGTASCDGYRALITAAGSGSSIDVVTNGSASALGATFTETPQAGDVYVFERIGTTLTLWRLRSGVWTEVASRTDSTHTGAGNVGMAQFAPTSGNYDDFIGGTVEAAGGPSQRFMWLP